MANCKRVFPLMLLLILCYSAFSQPVPLPANKHKVIVIAHRGDHTNAPENTLAAFKNAIEDGADFIETDLRTTSDSQLVVMHNISLEHMTGNNAEVKGLTLDSLKKIMVREPSHPEWGLHKIPTFKEVLQLCKGKINIYLDFKDAPVKQTYQQIIDAGMENNVVVYINEPHQFEEWETVAPNMPLMISLPRQVQTGDEMLKLLNEFNIDLLDGSYTEYNEQTILAAKEKGVPVWADIQSPHEGPLEWKTALDMGLAGLQTDHPKELVQYLKEKGIR